MAYSAPTTRSTGFFVTAAAWNQDVVDNVTFLANPPACRAYNSIAISIANNTNTIVTLDSERYDTATLHSGATFTGRLTAPVAGLYVIGGCIEWAANAAGTRALTIRLNGTTGIANVYEDIDSAIAHGQCVTTIYKLAANDYVEMIAYQNSGGALNVSATANYSPEFWMTWVGLG